MEHEPRERDLRFMILDGVRTEQRRLVAAERLQPSREERHATQPPPSPAGLVRQLEALEVIAGICEVQARAARAEGSTGAAERWHRLTGHVEGELAALRLQLNRPGG